MSGEEPLVDNPLYVGLTRLRADLLRDLDTFAKALDGPARDMAGGQVWMGRAARAWGEELTGRSQRLPGFAERLLHAVDAALAGTDPKVRSTTAKLIRIDLYGR